MKTTIKNKNDIKIFILYLMRNVGYPLEFSDINDIVVQDGFVSYFDFAECLSELIETENIKKTVDGDVEMYEMTEQGKSVADSLQSELLMMIRERSLKSALQLLSFKKRGASISFKSTPNKDGSFEVTCKIVEGAEEIFNMTLHVDNKKQLDRMEHSFRERPEYIYKGILSLMTGEADYLFGSAKQV